jgi:hypothetical protein
MDKPVKRDDKKPYTPPILTVYGTIREITQAVGLRRTRDNGSFPAIRTALR